MSDNYQAVFDAVRSKIQGCNVEEAIQSAFRDSGFSHYAQQAFQEISNAGFEQQRPFMLLRPNIYMDGDEWCALYGENLQDGIAGFGKTPHEAAYDFDKNWHLPISHINPINVTD